jgi:hypothetical protein
MKQKQTLMFNGMLAEKIGLNEAIVFQKLVYWQKKCSDRGWKKQFNFLSLRSIQRAFLSLENQGVIKCKKSKMCNFYQLQVDNIENLLLKNNTRSDCLNKKPNDKRSKKHYIEKNYRIYFEAENNFIATWINNHYSSKIKQAWHKANSKEVNVIISGMSHKIETKNNYVK